MANLKLSFVKEIVGGQAVTRTLIGKQDGVNNKIEFHNASDAPLTITFNPASAMDRSTLTVPVGRKEEVNFRAGKPLGTKVKYTATIDGAAPEDPIIIIERP